MPLLHVVILAVVQGLTEFLPISSSAHLALAPWLLGWQDQGLTFDIALHFGTLAAVLLYFYRDLLQVVGQGFGIPLGSDAELRKNRRLMWLIGTATIPVGVLGLLFADQAETTWRSPFQIAGMLIGVALVMALAERVGRRNRDIGQVTLADAMVVGLAQAVAIVPGTSRSGITIAAGLFRHLDRAPAARFSFLLSTPAIAAAAAKAFWDLHQQGGIPSEMVAPFVVGMAVSAATGCLVIGFLLRYLRRHSLKFFIYYRIVFGIIVGALALVFRQPAG